MHATPSRLSRRRCGVLGVVLAAAMLLAGCTAAARPVGARAAAAPTPSPKPPPVQITAQAFGMHAGCLGVRHLRCSAAANRWPQVPFGSYRIWDTGDTWRNVEPARGRWHFSALDERVAVLSRHGVAIDYVLGMTPTWAAADPHAQSPYGAGANSMPARLADWTRYVTEVATRYRGKISSYEIWNEPNIVQYWAGTPAQMATLAKAAYQAIKAADPFATVVSPSLSARTGGAMEWLEQFLAAGGNGTFDVQGLHIYPQPYQTPEQAFALVDEQRAILQRAGVPDVPVWDTEIGYGRTSPPPATLFTGGTADAYVARTYLMGLVENVARNYWYSYDNRGFVGLYLTNADGSPTEAARTYATTFQWLVGATDLGCQVVGDRYRCTLGYPATTGLVYWVASGAHETVPAPAGAVCLRQLDGSVQPVHPGAPVTISGMPQLLITANVPDAPPSAVPGTLGATDPC